MVLYDLLMYGDYFVEIEEYKKIELTLCLIEIYSGLKKEHPKFKEFFILY